MGSELADVRFDCGGYPADAVITLLLSRSDFQATGDEQEADPLLLVSLRQGVVPDLRRPDSYDASSMDQWREDAINDHFVTARGVGPAGGIVSVFNRAVFAGATLEGQLDLRCTRVMGFDFLFMDELALAKACPLAVGKTGELLECSGRGECMLEGGVCECFPGFVGSACEHQQQDVDVDVAASGEYLFELPSGRYQYFRVRVPRTFAGGYLEVHLESEEPLVALVRKDGMPTKSQFEICNFADWVAQKNTSDLRFPVDAAPAAAVPVPYGGQAHATGTWGPPDVCPHLPPLPGGEACRSLEFRTCQDHCIECMQCSPENEEEAAVCHAHCRACKSEKCFLKLKGCASDVSCHEGSEVETCQETCESCMTCMDSNDRACMTKCGCCQSDADTCLPAMAKCGISPHGDEDGPQSYVYVGLYNHRLYYDKKPAIKATVQVSLHIDPEYVKRQQPYTWYSDIFEPLHGHAPGVDDPVVEFVVQPTKSQSQTVQLGSANMALLHLLNQESLENLELRFGGWASFNVREAASAYAEQTAPNAALVQQVMASHRRAPKTLFDFDQVHVSETGAQRSVILDTQREKSIWCLLRGDRPGQVRVAIRGYGVEEIGESGGFGGAVAGFFAAIFGSAVFCALCGGPPARIGEEFGRLTDSAVPLSQRLGNLVRARPHESTASLTRGDSMAGYQDSETLQRSVEDRFLHRGGNMGDDGI